ncbi:hypothetical protein J2X65_005190 [Ancylobacter sp. 3268]|uniref:hypothetical protein n=1 Tax=Ancylobacter sp. 3268 TaxID=2817752 RepID=UPI00285EBDB5|nr:hypothetical protein [Ancylobacter sp. 3268]MDR6955807.1 hypothetical protein [Ancylobacter sp. 3268]
MLPVLTKALVSGSVVSLATTAALALLARAEGRHPVQPVNSTSHWYLGERAGRSRALDLPHTLGGFATHHAASVFWAVIFEAVRRYRPNSAPLGNAIAVSALAALVDYGVVPKRLTPGWEKVVAPRSIAIAYVVMAVALSATCPRRRGQGDRR